MTLLTDLPDLFNKYDNESLCLLRVSKINQINKTNQGKIKMRNQQQLTNSWINSMTRVQTPPAINTLRCAWKLYNKVSGSCLKRERKGKYLALKKQAECTFLYVKPLLVWTHTGNFRFIILRSSSQDVQDELD